MLRIMTRREQVVEVDEAVRGDVIHNRKSSFIKIRSTKSTLKKSQEGRRSGRSRALC